jgi:hypothetical protein
MPAGSGLFSKRKPNVPHLVQPGSELEDLRKDVGLELGKLASITREEFPNVPAAVTTGVKTVHATSAGTKVFTVGAGLDGASANVNLPFPRQFTVTTAGTTAADALNVPITVEGLDVFGRPQTEVVLAAGTATTVSSAKFYKRFTKVTEGPGVGGVTGATLAFGFGAPVGLSLPIATVQGATFLHKEVALGSVVTTGTVATSTAAPPCGSYTPSAAANGTNDYAVWYEFDPNVVTPSDVKAELRPPVRVGRFVLGRACQLRRWLRFGDGLLRRGALSGALRRFRFGLPRVVVEQDRVVEKFELLLSGRPP